MRSRPQFAQIEACYLEQNPKAQNWHEIITHNHVIVVPLLLSKGQHISQDIPQIFGLGPKGGTYIDQKGRKLHLLPGLRLSPQLIQMALDLIL